MLVTDNTATVFGGWESKTSEGSEDASFFGYHAEAVVEDRAGRDWEGRASSMTPFCF
jgi:hypothetical protein